ncbi:Ig-like domain-containing protein [Frondihabitans cladoniiphilus]|uniref:Ig-like domain-containing protein n=1 Tax=Frondihabitans cladoniiphilus TaxID=715785 RepID=A0ABP8VMC9_9MICO
MRRLAARLRARLPLVLSTAAAFVVVVLVAVIAFTSPGYSRQDVHLDDGSVWVANEAAHLVGSANTSIAKLSAAVKSTGNDVSLLQDESHLVVHDRGANTLAVIDPAQAKTTDTVPLPEGSPLVVSAGEHVGIYLPTTGDTWVTTLGTVAKYSSKSAPTMSLGVDAVLAMDSSGAYAGYSMKSRMLVTGSVDTTSGQASSSRRVSFPGKPQAVTATLVGGKPVLYDPASRRLWVDGRFVTLPAGGSAAGAVVLQQPSPTGGRVLVARGSSLLAVALDDGALTTLASRAVGNPSAPVVVDGCAYAVWSGGTALRACGTATKTTRTTLTGASASAAVSLTARGHHVVATDARSGNAWALQNGGRLIDNWSDFVDDTTNTTQTTTQEDVAPQLDPDQKPPVAVDDSFGIRAGRANTLPVLLNDSDPNGDPLLITSATAVDPQFGGLDIVSDGQKLQMTTRPTAAGSVQFQYTITDGYGNEAHATVTLTVHTADENGAPQQVRPTRTSVSSGGTVALNVLSDWVDPDSDPFYLQSASTASPSTVSFTQDGSIQYHDGGSAAGITTIALVVSDGSASGTGSVSVTVGAPGSVPIIAESFTVTGYTGQQISVAPLPNVRGGTGTVTLDGVTAVGGDDALQLQPDYSTGTFAVTATRAGTHHVRYSVTDGTRTANGTIRVDVVDPPSENLPPVTVPTTAFLYLQDSRTVDVLAGDSDPAGGVLSLVSLGGVPASSGIVAGIIDHGSLRVTLTRSLSAPVTFSYVVTNGKANATGSVTIVETPEPSRLQAPVAVADTATVRVGQVVDIPVLANDSQPDDKPLQLDESLVSTVPSGDGLLFTDRTQLRYLAPDKPGTYTAEYRVSQSDGQFATAPVTIVVKALDPANDRPPAPRTVTARVTAGGTVTIPIPLSGIDPDGDAVSLIGQATAPRLGAVSKVGSDYLTYQAGSYASGTDTFQYTVVDSVGSTGTGTIRIGVSASTGTVAPPLAQDDLVRTRPGTKLSVPVLANDSDPGQGTLSVTGVEASSAALTPGFTDTAVTVTAPTKPGSYGILYTAKDARGGTASAWLYLDVAADAPRAAPVATDITLTSQEVAGRKTVDVRPLDGVSFAEGTTADLELSLVPGYGGASILPGGVLRADVGTSSRIIPFRVARKDDPAVTSTAFLWVPGSEDGVPEVRSNAPALSVVSGSKLTIRLADQLVGVQGRAVRLTGSSSVSATYSNGSPLVADASTLQYTSEAGYFGPASITFTATDGPAGSVANQATITLAITVTPKNDEPPVLNGADLPLESGAQTTVDLQALTDYPYPDRRSELRYSAVSGTPSAVTASVSGSTLTIRTVDGTAVGTIAKVVVSVSDRTGAGKSGVVSVSVVRSTRPLVQPIPDAVTIRRGSQGSVSVLANDEATNPFPGHPLRVVDVGQGAALPAGVTVSTSADRSVVSIAVAKGASTGTVTIPYEVADETDDPNRYTSSTITATVQDVPDAPPAAPGILSKNTDTSSVTLAIPHAFPNFSDITGYTVRSTDGTVTATCANPDSCLVSGLQYGVPYAFTALATNGLGDGAPSPASDTVVVDGTPNPPQQVTLQATGDDPNGHSLLARWDPPTVTKGTPIQSYTVLLQGPGVSTSQVVPATQTQALLTDSGIQPGNQYSVSVTAQNKTNTSGPASAVSVSVGPPTNITVAAGLIYPGHVALQVSWTPGSPNGGSGLTYSVQRLTGGDPSNCSPGSMPGVNVGGATSWVDDGYAQGNGSYAVYASNGLFCSRFTNSSADTSLPAAPSGKATLSKQKPGGTEVATDILVGPLTDTSSTVDHYQYSLVAHGAQPATWSTIAQKGAYITGPGASSTAYGSTWDVYARACRFGGNDSCGPSTKIGDSLKPLAAVAATTPPPTKGP